MAALPNPMYGTTFGGYSPFTTAQTITGIPTLTCLHQCQLDEYYIYCSYTF